VDALVDAVAVYDLPAARETAGILLMAEASGRPMSLADVTGEHRRFASAILPA
jgi:hypothetical protein